MPMRREVWSGGRFGGGRRRMSCSWAMERGMVSKVPGGGLTCKAGARCPQTVSDRQTLRTRVSAPHGSCDKLRLRGGIMLVVMQAHATEEQVRAVCQKIE